MATFEIEAGGAKYQIDAPDENAAMSAFQSMGSAPAPDPAPAASTETPAPPVQRMDPASVDPTLGPVFAPGQTPVMPTAPTNPAGQQLAVADPRLAADARGLAQGATLGLADEAYGLGGGVRTFLGGQGFQPGYDRAVTNYRAGDKAADAAYPYSFGGMKVAGAVAPMVGAGATALGARLLGLGGGSLLGRTGASLGAGATIGGVTGFNEGEGDLAARVQSGENAAIAGGAFGAVAPAAGWAVGKGVNALAGALATRATPVPGLGNAAADMAGQDLQASGGRQAVIDQLQRLGPDAMLLDASPSFQGRAQGLAVQPETRQTLTEPLTQRNQATNARLVDALDNAAGPAPVPSQVEAQFQAIRDKAGPKYETALKNGPDSVDTSPILAEIGQRMNTASGAELAGLKAARGMLVERTPDGDIMPRTDPRYLHGVKQSLSDLIDYGSDQIGIPRGALSKADGSVSRIRSMLNGQLETEVPGYADANKMASTAHRASEAFVSGQEALGPNVHPYDFGQQFDAAPIERQAAVRLGVRADLDSALGNKANDLVALKQQVMSDGDWNRAKLAKVFGDEQAGQIFNAVDREAAFRDAYTKIVEGSQTAQRSVAAKGVEPRDISLGGNGGSGIAVAGLLGGHAGAGAAAGLKGLSLASSAAGRASDLARNEQLARVLTTQAGPNLDALIQALDSRVAARGRVAGIGSGTDRLVQLLLESQGNRARSVPAGLLSR